MVRGIRDAIGRATLAVRAVASEARAERAENFAAGLDAKRIDLLGADATLKLFDKAAGGELIAEITDGWYAEAERAEGELVSTYIVEFTERDGFTLDEMKRVDRLVTAGVSCTVENWEAPHESPRKWTIYAREIRPGGLRG